MLFLIKRVLKRSKVLSIKRQGSITARLQQVDNKRNAPNKVVFSPCVIRTEVLICEHASTAVNMPMKNVVTLQ
jgi:hypothetical protein